MINNATPCIELHVFFWLFNKPLHNTVIFQWLHRNSLVIVRQNSFCSENLLRRTVGFPRYGKFVISYHCRW